MVSHTSRRPRRETDAAAASSAAPTQRICGGCQRTLRVASFTRRAGKLCRFRSTDRTATTVRRGQLWNGWRRCNACSAASRRHLRNHRARGRARLMLTQVCGKCFRARPLVTATRCAPCADNGRTFWDRKYDQMRADDAARTTSTSSACAWRDAVDLEQWTQRTQAQTCRYCRVPLVFALSDPLDLGREASYDRILTQVDVGPQRSLHQPGNVLLACRLCQHKRCATPYEAFLRYANTFYAGYAADDHDGRDGTRGTARRARCWSALAATPAHHYAGGGTGQRRVGRASVLTPDDMRRLYERQRGVSPLSGLRVHLCGVPHCPFAASLDRGDSGGEYTLDNVALTTVADNLGKLTHSNAWFRVAERWRLATLTAMATRLGGGDDCAEIAWPCHAPSQADVDVWTSQLRSEDVSWLRTNLQALQRRYAEYEAFCQSVGN